jgi:hypothetical protein
VLCVINQLNKENSDERVTNLKANCTPSEK